MLRKFVLTSFLAFSLFFYSCSDSKKSDESPLVPEQDYYQILTQVFSGTANLPDDFAALLDDSFPPRGVSPLRSLESLDSSLLELWLFGTTISDNGFSLIKPGMKGKALYQVPGTDMIMDMDVDQFLMNIGIHTKAIYAIIEDDPDSDIKGILKPPMVININVDGQDYAIDREWIRQNSYFSAYTLLGLAKVIKIDLKPNEYPIPADFDVSRFEIFTYDADGNVVDKFEKPSQLLRAISNLTQDNPTLTYLLKMEVSVPADFDGDGNYNSQLLLPYGLYGKADISFPLLTNYTSREIYSSIDPRLDVELCHYTDPTIESGCADPDGEWNQTDPNPSWWLPNIPAAVYNQPKFAAIKNTLFIDEGERCFDVDWWRDLEILTIVPGLGLSDVGMFASYSGTLSGGGQSVDLSQFNKNDRMDTIENRAVFFDRMFRMNGFRLTDNGNFLLGDVPYPESGLMDSPKIDIDAQGNITFGGKYDGPTRLVGVHTLADSIPVDLKIFFILNGLVPEGTTYDVTGVNGYAKYIKNVKAYLPCPISEDGWQEVNMYQLLQYIADKWDKIGFYSGDFVNADIPTTPELTAWLTKYATDPMSVMGKFPMVDKGELSAEKAPFIIRADITVPEKGETYEGLEILSSAFGGFYLTNFYKGAIQ